MMLGQGFMALLIVPSAATNPAPVCGDDGPFEYAMGSNNNSIDVLLNDANTAGGTLTITVPPAHGTASVSNNRIIYSPTNLYVGADQLTYQVATAAGSDTAVVTMTMINADDPPDPPPTGTLTAVPDTFRMQTGTTKELWVAWNDVRPREARVISTSAGTIVQNRKCAISYTAPSTAQTVNIAYTIDDEVLTSSSTATVNVVSGTPAAIAQRCKLEIYNKANVNTRFIRPLQHASGSNVTVDAVTSQPAVGSASRTDAQKISVTVPVGTAPQSTSFNYRITSGNGTATSGIDVAVQAKPACTWKTGLLIGWPDVTDWIAQIGRNPTMNAGFTRLIADGGPIWTTFERLRGDNFTAEGAQRSMFGTPSWTMSNFESGLNSSMKLGMDHFVSYPTVPDHFDVRSNPVGWAKFLSGGLYHSDFTNCWFTFGRRFATYIAGKNVPMSRIVVELGKEMSTTEPYQILSSFVEDGKSGFKLAVDHFRRGVNNFQAGLDSQLRFCFRPAGTRKAGNDPAPLPRLTQLFPGNSHYAIVGMSFHDGESDWGTEGGWADQLFGTNVEYGISELYETAVNHNVRMGVPEWDFYLNYSLPNQPTVVKNTSESREVCERWFRWLYEHRDRLEFETYLSQENRFRGRWTTWGAAIAYKALWSN